LRVDQSDFPTGIRSRGQPKLRLVSGTSSKILRMDLVPLFPLEVVLFPGMALPLHIFEPRYKEMIGELLQAGQPFGVVRAVDNGIAEIGCVAEIVEVTKTYEDGRLDIMTQGQSRF